MTRQAPLFGYSAHVAKDRWDVGLGDIEAAVEDGRLTLTQGLDAAHALGRTGLPQEYWEALGVESKDWFDQS